MALYNTSRPGSATKYGPRSIDERQLEGARTILRSHGLSVEQVFRVVSAGEWGSGGDVYLYMDEGGDLRECSVSRLRVLWDHPGWADKEEGPADVAPTGPKNPR